MSYSYVKTVFPKFQQSTVHDDKLYKDLNMELTPSDFKPNDLYNISQANHTPIKLDAREANYMPIKLDKSERNIEHYENGLKAYHQPIVNNNIPEYNNIEFLQHAQLAQNTQNTQNTQGTQGIQGAQGAQNTQSNEVISHEIFIKHVMECNICKDRLLKQFNIQTERIRNEEIMELISYIMVGIFILILLDNLKNKS
jgi:hypothetical protein